MQSLPIWRSDDELASSADYSLCSDFFFGCSVIGAASVVVVMARCGSVVELRWSVSTSYRGAEVEWFDRL